MPLNARPKSCALNRALACVLISGGFIGALTSLARAETTPATPAWTDPFTKGKFSLNTRYRYEIYDQDTVPGATTAAAGKIDGTAVASTLRVTVGYETAPLHGLDGFVEVEGVYAVGEEENYRITTVPDQAAKTRAVINDPLGTELHQAYLKWQVPDTGITLLAGREAFFLNNGRFLSFSAWRQNNQSIDLARVSAKFAGSFTANYAYLDQVYRVVGRDATDGDLGMSSHVASLDYAKKGVINASVYTLLLDYDLAAQSANDTATTGLRLTGPYKLNDTWSIVYTADYAHQTDYADNTLDVSLDYLCLELGVGYKAHKAFVGYTLLEGGGGKTLRTPLAHPFNGWTEKFSTVPAAGLEAFYVTFTGPAPFVKYLTYTVIGYDYSADSTGAHYGTELDAALEWKATPIHKNLTFGWRLGQYFADQLFTDSLRTSVYAAFKL